MVITIVITSQRECKLWLGRPLRLGSCRMNQLLATGGNGPVLQDRGRSGPLAFYCSFQQLEPPIYFFSTPIRTTKKSCLGVEFSEKQGRHFLDEAIDASVPSARDLLETLVLIVRQPDDQCAHGLSSLRNCAGVTAASPGNRNSVRERSRTFPVTIRDAPPATANSTRCLSASSARLGRHAKYIRVHLHCPRNTSSNSPRSPALHRHVRNNAARANTSSCRRDPGLRTTIGCGRARAGATAATRADRRAPDRGALRDGGSRFPRTR